MRTEIINRILKLYLDELKHGWSLSNEHHEGLLNIGDCNRDEVKKDIAETLNDYEGYSRLRTIATAGMLGNGKQALAYHAFERLIDEKLAKYEQHVADIIIEAMGQEFTNTITET